MKRISAVAVLFFIFCFVQCSNNPGNKTEYIKWLNTEENNLVKTKYINGLEISVKYMPPEYLAYLETKNQSSCNEKCRDSILATYKDAMTFLMSIGPDERKEINNDIMFKNIGNYEEYKERVMTMNFEMDEFITLFAGNKEYKPILTNMENTYGLTKHRNIILVFADDEKMKTENGLKESGEFDLVYEDELFELGINHFVFNKKDINNIPSFTFWSN